MAVTPTSASDLFDNILPKALAAHPDKAREVGVKYAFKISGDGGGDWTVDLADDPPHVSKGAADSAQCTISVSNEDFISMLGNQTLGMQYFMQGRLRVVGDPMLAMKLQKLFALA